MTEIQNLIKELNNLEIVWTHNMVKCYIEDMDINNSIKEYEKFELNIDKSVELSKIKELILFLYKKDWGYDKETLEEIEEEFNDYIKEYGDIVIKLIFDIWFHLESDGYNQENIIQLNSIRVYDDNINKEIPPELIRYLKNIWFGMTTLLDINYLLDNNNDYNELYKIIWTTLWKLVGKEYKPCEIVFNYWSQRILLFIPNNVYNKKLVEKIEDQIREIHENI